MVSGGYKKAAAPEGGCWAKSARKNYFFFAAFFLAGAAFAGAFFAALGAAFFTVFLALAIAFSFRGRCFGSDHSPA